MSSAASANEEEDNMTAQEDSFIYYSDRRHETQGRITITDSKNPDWRMRERLKTVSVCLVLCLNIGVSPPDTIKPAKAAITECWIDPFSQIGF